jgi:hypothetical protein
MSRGGSARGKDVFCGKFKSSVSSKEFKKRAQKPLILAVGGSDRIESSRSRPQRKGKPSLPCLKKILFSKPRKS